MDRCSHREVPYLKSPLGLKLKPDLKRNSYIRYIRFISKYAGKMVGSFSVSTWLLLLYSRFKRATSDKIWGVTAISLLGCPVFACLFIEYKSAYVGDELFPTQKLLWRQAKHCKHLAVLLLFLQHVFWRTKFLGLTSSDLYNYNPPRTKGWISLFSFVFHL